MNHERKKLFLALAIFLALSTWTLAAVSSSSHTASGIQPTDQQIAVDVTHKIRNYVFYDIYDWVDLKVNRGVVTLEGWAHEPWHKYELGKRVESVIGVKQVQNQIQVLPLSPFDDRLRIQLARKIYGNPVLDRYAVQLNPPIHIIVDHGVVTLRGVVASAAESHITGTLAHESSAFKVINDLTVETKG